MKAVMVEKPGGSPVVVNGRPEPRLRDTYMLVRTVAVALNPVDVALGHMMTSGENCLIGCDYAGIVEEVGSGVHRNFKKGDRVCGGQRAGDPHEKENGCFAELICVKADMAMHIPPSMSFEEASTLGVCQLTTGRCLYQKFGLSWPDPDRSGSTSAGQLFVYGGSSAMGTMVTQFAKLSNFEVITTSSPRNFDLVKAYGADHVFDYSDPDAPEKIQQLTKNPLKIVVDCIATAETAAFCSKVIAAGGKYSAILPTSCPRDDVESVRTIGYSFLGEEWEQFSVMNPASKEDFEYSKGFAELSEKLLEQGKIKPHPVDLREGGLDGVPAALEDLRLKKVSGKKIVFTV